MIPKSGYRFSEKIMLKKSSMIPKSGRRFSDKIMLKKSSMIPNSRCRFPAFAKLASGGQRMVGQDRMHWKNVLR